jgi:3-hydroxybutyrate dehydrogenase
LAIAHFIERKKPGSVVHISSVAGQIPSFPTPMYVASKFAISGFVRSLYRLENPPPTLPKIRVTAVSPGLIKTPLWTDHPEKLKWMAGKDSNWVTPEDVAQVMLDLVEKEEHVGGTILEIGGKSVRKVGVYNDIGPVTAGNAGEHTAPEVENEVWESLGRLSN